MRSSHEVDKGALLTEIDEAWRELWAFIGQLPAEAMTHPTDAVGWNVKDHLAHLVAWERSIGFLLTSRDRHDGLGVERYLYLSGDYDAINSGIRQQTRDLTPQQVLDLLRTVHEQTPQVLSEKSESDLALMYSDYAPNEPGRETGEPIVNYLLGNTAHHYHEHMGWIRKLLGN